jgi:phospholipid/cholesterol/gamma-HCH transport system substrate-binding protein
VLVRRFRERSRARVGVAGTVVVLVLIVLALEFPRLPLIHSNATYDAAFSDAGGLTTGDIVTVDGVKVGTITAMTLRGDYVDVAFTVDPGVRLGSTTSASAQVLSPVGTEYMELDVSGGGSLTGTIPESRTSVPYNLVTDLSGLGTVIQHYDIPELEKALDVTGQDLDATSSKEITSAFDGLARVSGVLGGEQSALATIVTQGAGLTGVLSQRSAQLFDLFGQANLVLEVLRQRSSAIHQLLAATSSLGSEIDDVLSVNRSQLTTLLQSLQGVSAVLAKDGSDIAAAMPVLEAFSRYSANSTGSGPFADVAIPTLLVPDNLVTQCSKSGAFPSTSPQVGCRP